MVEHSGAEVAALGVAAERLANYTAEAEADDAMAVELMLSSGIPEEIALALQTRLRLLSRLGRAGRTSRGRWPTAT